MGAVGVVDVVNLQDSRRISILLGVLFGLTGMGSASAAIAVPLLAEDLETTVGLGTWTITLYALMLAVATPIYGRVADLVGVRLPLMVGVGLMTAGAVLSAAAPSFEALLVARVIQGAGAAAIPTLGVTVLSARYDGPVRGLALGRLAGVAAALSCLGPLLGGLVEAQLGWRAVMALPIFGLLILPFVWRALHGGGTRAKLDIVGAVLVAGTSAGLVLLIQSPSTGWIVALAGVLLLVLGVPAVTMQVRRRPQGFLPHEVITNSVVIRSAIAAAAVPAAWFGILIAVPAVMIGHGWEAWEVGLLLAPSAVVGLVVPRIAGPFLNKYGAARALAFAGVNAAVSMLVASIGAENESAWALAVAVLFTTISFGVGQPALMASVGDAVHVDVRGVALGVATLLFLVGGSVGSAVVGGLGDVYGMPRSLLVLAVLPVLGIVALVPMLRSAAPAVR
ncbi:MFS family permease [Nocardioides daedukensis]|uniref:MFS family permease n=1 Tax=Nocardioides daedukensis TaxID=634462 RepID=A0A7Y9S4F6_9ACTN|nr:MFS transporter [Nocardioides daedukensis]NYG59838.1 MFS family permease [Nocardioides daedukensis]